MRHGDNEYSTIAVLDQQASGLPDPLDRAQALIAEARQRQRGRRRRTLSAVVILVVLATATTVVVRATSTPGPTPSSQAGQRAPLSAGPFAGTWHVHTTSVTLHRDGRGTAVWPIDLICGSGIGKGPSPCDRWVPSTMVLPDGTRVPVERIIDGGRATLELTRTTGRVAHGVVTDSTDPAMLPDGPAGFSLTTDDLLHITLRTAPTVAPLHWDALCGAKAAALSLAAQQAQGINCGA